jgi:DNA-binding MarR family transcriptional regulator
MNRPPEKTIAARRAWKLMFDYLVATSPDRTRGLARRGLTPNDARALWSLNESEPRPIGSLAREWDCDPSNATFIVDRLVRAGLAERRESAADRRVKLIGLTPTGESVKQDVIEEQLTPPPSLAELTQEDLETLVRVLEKLGPSQASQTHLLGN